MKKNYKVAACYLYLIYSGELNPEDKDLEKARHWKNIYDKRMSEAREYKIKEWNDENEKIPARSIVFARAFR